MEDNRRNTVKDSRVDVLIKPYRRAGNTTRIVDNAIQILFDEGEVIVRDHAHTPQNKFPTRTAFDNVIRRLQVEHNMIDDIEINPNDFIIRIKNFKKSIQERRVSKTQVELIYNHKDKPIY